MSIKRIPLETEWIVSKKKQYKETDTIAPDPVWEIIGCYDKETAERLAAKLDKDDYDVILEESLED